MIAFIVISAVLCAAIVFYGVVVWITERKREVPQDDWMGQAVATKGMRAKDIDAVSKKQTVMKILVQVGLYVFLVFMAIIVLFPFYWMLISSLKSQSEYNASIPTYWPKQFHWENYKYLFVNVAEDGMFIASDFDLKTLFLNTVLVGVVSTLLSLIVTVLAAYAFARLEFKGKNALFAALLATMMLPGELFTITNYVTVSSFGWITDKVGIFTALVVPFLVSVFYIYLLRQNFMQIPNELYLAAKVDGTSDLKYLWKVMIPLSAPTLISITILKMMGAWNSYIWPNLIGGNIFQLVTVGLRSASFQNAAGETLFPIQMAAVVLVTLPLLLVFIFLRKYIMRGVSRSGIKG